MFAHDIRKKELSGYFTVEASLILPMVLLFLVTMLFLAIYSYDRCMLEQCAYEAALRGSRNYYQSNVNAYEETQRAAKELMLGKIFAVDELRCTVDVSHTSVAVAYECVVKVPLLTWLKQFVTDTEFVISVSKKVPRDRQVAIIRAFQAAGKGMEYGSDKLD